MGAFLDKLGTEDIAKRKNAIEELLSQPLDVFIPLLEQGIKCQDNATLRNASMEAFLRAGAKGVPSLLKMLCHDDEDVRVFAASILGDIKDRSALKGLFEAMKDEDINVRAASIEALGKIAESRAIGHLVRAVDDDPWVAVAAIDAIAHIGGEEALDALYKFLENESYLPMAIDAIERIGDISSIRALTSYVEGGKHRELALKAIVNIAGRLDRRPSPEYFLSVVPMLIELQASSKPEIKKAAFIALSWSEDVRGIKCLIDEVNDEELQEYAIKGLLGIGRRAIPAIIDGLKQKRHGQRYILAKLLSMTGEREALLQFAGDEDPEVRVEVALALGSMNSPRAGEILLKLLKDPDEEVRAASYKSRERLNQVK
jgi:HEAT repeat protein